MTEIRMTDNTGAKMRMLAGGWGEEFGLCPRRIWGSSPNVSI